MFEEMMSFEKRIQQEHELKYREYERLCADAPKLVKAGDRVIVAVGFLGHGFHWIRQECEVVDVKGCNVKIQWPMDKLFRDNGETHWVYWIPLSLVTAVL